LYFPLSS